MGQIPNIRRIRTEDFPEEYQQVIEKLAFSLNNFMDETISLFSGNIDVTNLTQEIKEISVEVDSGGELVTAYQFKTDLVNKIEGIWCIAATRTDSEGYPDSQPFISFTFGETQNIIKINNISGLQNSSEYNLKLLLIS